MKKEALKLADELENIYLDKDAMNEAIAMIRRLVEELDKQEERNLKIVRKNEKLLGEFFRVKEELECANDYIKQYQLEKQSEPYVWHMKSNDPDSVKDYWYFIDKPSRESKISHQAIPLYTTPQTKPLSDEEIGDCVDDYFGLMALQHKYIYDIDQIQEYGLKLARAIEERHWIK